MGKCSIAFKIKIKKNILVLTDMEVINIYVNNSIYDLFKGEFYSSNLL